MTTFTINVTDKALLAGITAARGAFNNALPDEKDDKGVSKPVAQRAGYIATDDAYWQARVTDMLRSWAKTHGFDATELAAKEAEVAAIKAKMAEQGL